MGAFSEFEAWADAACTAAGIDPDSDHGFFVDVVSNRAQGIRYYVLRVQRADGTPVETSGWCTGCHCPLTDSCFSH